MRNFRGKVFKLGISVFQMSSAKQRNGARRKGPFLDFGHRALILPHNTNYINLRELDSLALLLPCITKTNI
jgi:hypothetical protein